MIICPASGYVDILRVRGDPVELEHHTGHSSVFVYIYYHSSVFVYFIYMYLTKFQVTWKKAQAHNVVRNSSFVVESRGCARGESASFREREQGGEGRSAAAR